MEQLASARTRLAMLIEAAATVAGTTGLLPVLRSTVDTAMDLTAARYGALGVIGEHGTLVDFIHAGLDLDQAGLIGRLPEGRGVLGLITRERRPVRIDDITSHPDAYGFPEHHPKMTCMLGVPVRVGETVFGNLYLTDKPGGFTAEDEELVGSLAVVAGSAVANARLHERLRRLALVEDRERIARELHDSVIQELFAVGLSLQTAASHTASRPDEVKRRLLDAVDQLDSSITTLRRYIFDIREDVWPDRDLGGRLRELAGQLAAPSGVQVDVNVTGDWRRLRPDLTEDILQLAREAISNAVRHSGAPRLAVSALIADHEVQVQIRDAGSGFDLEGARRGMGLDNMRTRVEAAGGRTSIETAPGAGTLVRVWLPLHDE